MTTCCNHNCAQGDRCPIRQACELPEPSTRRVRRVLLDGPHFPRTRKGWGRVIQAGLGIAGTLFIVGAMARHWGLL